MTVKNQKFVWVVVLAALMLAGGVSLRMTVAQAQPAEKAPTQLAVVDIVKLFAKLDEKRKGDDEIKRLDKELDDQRRQMEESLQKKSDALRPDGGLFSRGTPEYKQAEEQLLEDTMKYKAFMAVADAKRMMLRRLKTVEIYRKINTAIEKYAKANGIAIVFCVDELEFEGMSDISAINGAILTQRKIMYAHPNFDITQKLVLAMNAEYTHGAMP